MSTDTTQALETVKEKARKTADDADRLGRRLWDWMKDEVEPDRLLMSTTAALIEAQGMKYALGLGIERWRPGKALKLLFAGYVGTRNTGADVRVEEMVRQVRHVLGDDAIALTMMTSDPKLTKGYFRTARQVTMPTIFPKFLFDECPKHHGVIACEGSMFKSKFASALSTMMAGSLGFANAEQKLSVGYGAEAGHMIPSLQDFVQKHCRDSLVLCRNQPSRGVLEALGIRTRGGTDTAWTFDPAPPERGRQLLQSAGWDGKAPVLIACPINPFWWPVKPDLQKAAAYHLSGEHKSAFYKSIYFHASGQDVATRYEAYLDGFCEAISAFAQEKAVFPILVGMEQLDRRACEHLAAKLQEKNGWGKVPIFVSDEHDMYDLVSVLRQGSLMVSSRFHAIVTSMPGLVPSCGVTMDERIRNLMATRGHDDLFLEVDDPELGEKLLAILRRVDRERERIRDDIARTLPGELRLMGQMGIDFKDEVARVYPEFALPDLGPEPIAHLPALPRALQELLERSGG